MGDDWIEPTAENLQARGIARRSRGASIRSMCLQCMGGSAAGVRECVSSPCPLWPYRLGSDPWRAPMSDEQRAAAAERMTKARAAMEVEPVERRAVSLFDLDEED